MTFQKNSFVGAIGLSQIFLLLIFSTTIHAQTYQDCLINSDQVGGRVYLDYNSNATWESSGVYSENGAEAVEVVIYNDLGVELGTTTTNAKGEWGMVVGNGASVRVEFNLPDHFTAAPAGGSSKSQIAFATAPDCAVDLGVHDPLEYCQEDPEVAMICHVKWWGAGTVPQAVTIDYSDGSNSTTDFSGYEDHNHPVQVPYSETGNLWGLTYNRDLDLIYTSACYKGGTDVSTDGLGAIYYIDNTANTGANASVNTAALLTTLSAGNDPTNGEPWNTDPGETYFDANFDGSGKLGLGGLALNGNRDTLWTINLFSRKLIGMPLAANGKSVTGTNVSIDMPSPTSCTGDEIRPWALKWYRGKLYVGMVCSGEITQEIDTVRGYVYTYTPGAAAMSSNSVLEIDFGYNRGDVSSGAPAEWNPWKTVWNVANPIDAMHVNSNHQGGYPSPIISDIEFDKEDMILGIMDRFGDQFQSGPDPAGVLPGNPGNGGRINMVPGGDILKAGYSGNGTWSCESDGSVTSSSRGNYSGATSVTGEGPEGKEFYYYDQYAGHDETTLGGLAMLPGRNEIMVGAFDPTPVYYEANPSEPHWGSGGIIWLNNDDGGYSKGWEGYYNDPTQADFSKGNGFGDIEPLCKEKPSLEIGNLIWDDTNNNGSQDGGEGGIAGILVSLYSSTGTLLATTSTDVNGNYLFSKDGVAGQNWVSGTTVLENTTYYLTFGEGQFTANKLTVSNTEYTLGGKDMASSSNNDDLIDSDAAVGSASDPAWVENFPFVQVSTGDAGYNVHQFDVGFDFVANLPIDLTSFFVNPVDCNLELGWNIQNAAHFSLFEIEQAVGHGLFTKLGEVKAESQKSNYNFTINNEQNSIQYLRLKMVDQDGSFTYSEILNINHSCGNELEWTIYPNPTNKIKGINIEVKSAELSYGNYGYDLQIDILDAVGKKYYSNSIDARNGVFQITLEDFLPGVYTIILSDRNGYQTTRKLVVTQ